MKKLLLFFAIVLPKFLIGQSITIDPSTPFAACGGQNITVNFIPSGGATGPYTVELIENYANQGGQFCGPPANGSTVRVSTVTSTNSASIVIPNGLLTESGGGPPLYCNYSRWYEIKVYNNSITANYFGITLSSCSPVMSPRISPNFICSGKTGNVSWYSSGTNSGNVFTLELSNSSGSFSSPVPLGTLSGNNVDGYKTQTVTIPANTTSGSGYLIKVKSSDPVSEKTFGFTVNSVANCGPVQAVVVPNSLCSGATSSVSYTLDDAFQAGNVFTAELSNQNGSFTNPTTVGSVTSQTATSVPITLPSNLPFGNYNVRIVASLPSSGTPYTSPISNTITIGLPIASIFLNPSNVCENGTLSLELSTGNYQPESNYTFTWKKDGSNINALNQSTSSGNFQEYFRRTPPQSSDAGAYTVTVSRNNDNCATTSNSTNVTISPASSPPSTTPVTTVSGSTVTLTASGCVGSLIWYNSQTGGNSVSATTPELTQQTTYYVACQQSTFPFCISTRTPLVVSVDASNAPNAPTIVASDNNFCAGSVTTPKLTATGCTGIVRWYYKSNPNDVSYYLAETDNTAPYEYLISNSNTRKYAADCRENNILSTSKSEVTVTVKSVPSSPSLDPSYFTINSGSDVLHNIYGSNCNGGTVKWYDASTAGNLLFTGSSYTKTNVITGYNIYASCTINGCESSRSSGSVGVSTSGVVGPSIYANANEICGSGTSTLTAIGCTQGTVNWYSYSNSVYTNIGTGQSFTTPTLSHTGSSSTLYFYYHADCTIGANTSSKNSKTINVYKQPTTPSANEPTIACNSSASLTATNCSSSNNFYVRWYESQNATNQLSSSTTFNTPTLSATTTYYLECYNSSSNNCKSARIPITVTVGCTPPAAPQITANLTTVCAGTGINLTATGCANAVNWSDGGTGAIRSNVIFNSNISLTATCNNGLASGNSNNLSITVNPKPILVITNPAAVAPPSTVDLTASAVTTGSTFYGASLSYHTDIEASVSLPNPATISVSNTYYIKATTTAGCTDIMPVNVVISDCGTPINLVSTTDDYSNGTTLKKTNETIVAKNKITGSANVTYRSSKSITLDPGTAQNPGFKADAGTVFKAEIGGCN